MYGELSLLHFKPLFIVSHAPEKNLCVMCTNIPTLFKIDSETLHNLAILGSAKQSSICFGGSADRAIDGNTNVAFLSKSVVQTCEGKASWWEVKIREEVELYWQLVQP